jgi:hypothetical protein
VQLFNRSRYRSNPSACVSGRSTAIVPSSDGPKVAIFSSSVRARPAKGSIDSRNAMMQSGSVLPIVPSRSKRTVFHAEIEGERNLATMRGKVSPISVKYQRDVCRFVTERDEEAGR